MSQGISRPALNQTVCALRLFYGVPRDRRRSGGAHRLCAHAAQAAGDPERRLGVRILEAVPSLKGRTALTAAYAAGSRTSEAVSLKVADIDTDRMVIQVRHGMAPGSHGDAAAAVAWDLVFPTGALPDPRRLGVSRARPQAHRPAGPARDPPLRDRSSGLCQAVERPYATPQFWCRSLPAMFGTQISGGVQVVVFTAKRSPPVPPTRLFLGLSGKPSST